MTQSVIRRSVIEPAEDFTVFKRKGGRVRYQHRHLGYVTEWFPAPFDFELVSSSTEWAEDNGYADDEVVNDRNLTIVKDMMAPVLEELRAVAEDRSVAVEQYTNYTVALIPMVNHGKADVDVLHKGDAVERHSEYMKLTKPELQKLADALMLDYGSKDTKTTLADIIDDRVIDLSIELELERASE